MEPNPRFRPASPPSVPPARITYRATELAAMTGLAVKTIYGAVNRGELPAYKRGRSVLIPAAEAMVWIRGADTTGGR